MSSSSPRNANSRSKSTPAEPRKRTQEVETGEGGETLNGAAGKPAEAIVAPEGATPAQLATSALDAADQALRAPSAGAAEQDSDRGAGDAPQGSDADRDQRDSAQDGRDADKSPAAEAAKESSATDDPAESSAPQPSNGGESSPLGREIMGAAQDLEGDWAPESKEVPGAAPSSPLEMMDETDLVDGIPGTQSGLIVGGARASSTPAMRDEEFLRRVVLPPLPQPAGSLPQGAYLEDDSGDKTVISDPPTPEMRASFARRRPAGVAASETARAIHRRLKTPVALTTLELIGLLTGSALAGGVIGALLMSVPQAAADRQAPPASAMNARVEVTASPIPPVIPLPPQPRPTVESLPPPEERNLQPSEATVAPTKAKRTRRAAPRKTTLKKEWVDPFEQ
jgi:hypothetical protein